MNRNIFKLALILLVLAVLLPACASQTGRSYSASETRKAQSVKFGVVTQIRDAVIEDDPSGAGTLGGAVAGGVIGSAFGGGSGRFYTTAAGAALGALAGTAAEKGLRTKEGQEIMVRLDDGQEMVVVQEVDKQEPLYVGDKVRVIYASNGSARVRPQ